MQEKNTNLVLEPFAVVSTSSADTDQPRLPVGHPVVVVSGILQGSTGKLVKQASQGDCLLALEGQSGKIWARLPANLLRTA